MVDSCILNFQGFHKSLFEIVYINKKQVTVGNYIFVTSCAVHDNVKNDVTDLCLKRNTNLSVISLTSLHKISEVLIQLMAVPKTNELYVKYSFKIFILK